MISNECELCSVLRLDDEREFLILGVVVCDHAKEEDVVAEMAGVRLCEFVLTCVGSPVVVALRVVDAHAHECHAENECDPDGQTHMREFW